jgi:hypothetical protein
MIHFNRAQFIVVRAAGSAHPNALLALSTTVVFAIALVLGWTAPSEAQNPCRGGADYCMLSAGMNPCAGFNQLCQATGPGYTCTVLGNPNPQPEGTYKLVAKSPWQNCRGPATSSTMSCTATYQSC